MNRHAIAKMAFMAVLATGLPAAGATAPGAGDGAAGAAARLRALYFIRDFEGGTAEGVRLAARFPDADEVRAWYLMNRVRPWHEDEALVRDAEAMVAKHPDGPWARFALAGVFTWSNVRYAEALNASRRALEAMPEHPDALWLRATTLAMHGKEKKAIRFVERHLASVRDPANLLNARAVACYRLARGDGWSIDEDLMAPAFAALEQARHADPKNVNARYLHGDYLNRMKRHAEAYPLLKQAIALAPLSTDVHEAFWQAVMGLTDRPAAKKNAEIEADIRRLRAARGTNPETLHAVVRQYEAMGLKEKERAAGDRILRAAPDSSEAEYVLASRHRDFAEQIHRNGAAPSLRDKRAYARLLRQFIARPRHREEALLGEAYAGLFYALGDDPAVGAEELLEIGRNMIKHDSYNAHGRYARVAAALADRESLLPEAEEMARAAFPAIDRHLEEHRDSYDGEEAWISWRDDYLARAHDALGWVLFRRDRPDEAERELLASHDLSARSSDNLHHLGMLNEARGDLDRAEAFYARGLQIEVMGENPCVAAFEALYEKRHGSREGLQAYLDQVQASNRDARLKRVLEARLEEPAPIDPFDLGHLGGGRLSSADLKGKITVINFWGLWCGWCVEEMPDVQKLHEQYRDDPGVRVLTIDNDPSPDKVRDWMRRQKFDFPVLIDDGYLARSSVHTFPTTWFLDREGRKVFEQVGYTKYLAEEFAWRVEAIRKPEGGSAGGEP
jgi:thiol-disulfide isomerase/thioredoxin/Flp pilus assembly protein TadD